MTVVYAADRKWYKHLPTAIGSLLIHNPDAIGYISAEYNYGSHIIEKYYIKKEWH